MTTPENGTARHADKGKKSRFRQLTDLVKSGVSAATSKANSKANSRTPSRGVTQDLEGFEAAGGPNNQAALDPVDIVPSQTVSQNKNMSTQSTARPRESVHETAMARPVAEGHAHSRQVEPTHAEALSDFAEILAAQPLRSASSAALLSHHPQDTAHIITTQMQATKQHPKERAVPIAEGTEARQPVKPSPGLNSKMSLGFMSGASTGRGAASKAPVVEAAAASAGKANQNEQDSESSNAHADDVTNMQR